MVDDAPAYLNTDASDYGIGAYLYQIIEGEKKPIAFLSKTMSKVQQRWSTIEKECYAIWYAVRHWEFLLRDIFFTIRTDHRHLKYLNTNTPKVVRWKLAVQEYNFQVEDITGPTNVIADDFHGFVRKLMIQKMFQQHQSQRLLQQQLTHSKYLVLSTKRLVVVCNTRQGHFGVELTIKKLKALYPTTTWLRMRAHIQQFIRQCPVCQKLSAIKEAANHILQHCGRFGTPLQILSDAGTQFLNELVDELLVVLWPEKIEGSP